MKNSCCSCFEMLLKTPVDEGTKKTADDEGTKKAVDEGTKKTVVDEGTKKTAVDEETKKTRTDESTQGMHGDKETADDEYVSWQPTKPLQPSSQRILNRDELVLDSYGRLCWSGTRDWRNDDRPVENTRIGLPRGLEWLRDEANQR